MSDIFDHELDALEDEYGRQEWEKWAGSQRHDTRNKICKLCGCGGLQWVRLGPSGYWRLADSKRRIHDCAKPAVKPQAKPKTKTLNCYDELV